MSTKIESIVSSPPLLQQEDKKKAQTSQPTTQETQTVGTQPEDEVISAAPTCINHNRPLWMQTGEYKTTYSAQTGIDNTGTLRFGIESKFPRPGNNSGPTQF